MLIFPVGSVPKKMPSKLCLTDFFFISGKHRYTNCYTNPIITYNMALQNSHFLCAWVSDHKYDNSSATDSLLSRLLVDECSL